MTIMTSIKVNEDVLQSSPIQNHNDSGYSAHDIFGYNIDISPIRKKVPNRKHLASIGNILLERDNDLENVSRQLPFTNCNDSKSKTVSLTQFDSGIESMCSGIESNNSSTNTGTENLYEYSQSFPIDYNSNLQDNHMTDISIICQPYKYICRESLDNNTNNKSGDFSSQLLDKNNNALKNVTDPKRKTSTIDFLLELSLRNCTSIISQILSYIPDEDLPKLSYVSKDWQNITLNDKMANKRRSDYIINKRNITRGPNKENRFQKRCLTKKSHKSTFLSILNASSEESKQPLYNNNLGGTFAIFCQVVKTLQDQDKLMKCPKCNYPSKIESGSKYCCSKNSCLYEFCKKCLGPYMDNHFCSELTPNTLPSIIIGNKKSKKNLRRL